MGYRMKRIVNAIRKFFTVFVLSLAFSAASSPSLYASNHDKIAHAAVGTAIYGVCLVTGKVAHLDWLDYKTCLIPVGVAAVGKEIYDAQGNGDASAADAGATMAIPALFAGIRYTLYEW